jgi:hypothetical protein
MCLDCIRHRYAINEIILKELPGKTIADQITFDQKCFPCPIHGQVKNKKK